MANVTEKDIIDHLREKIKYHEKEVKRIESLMSAFMGTSGSAKGTKVKAEAISEAKEPLPGKKEKQAAPVKGSKTKGNSKPLSVPEAYSDSLTLNEKIAFALKELGSGFNEEIAKVIADQSGADEKKISKQISGVLSALKTTGKLKTSKEGRRDKYSFV